VILNANARDLRRALETQELVFDTDTALFEAGATAYAGIKESQEQSQEQSKGETFEVDGRPSLYDAILQETPITIHLSKLYEFLMSSSTTISLEKLTESLGGSHGGFKTLELIVHGNL
jgi:hypothetical protein